LILSSLLLNNEEANFLGIYKHDRNQSYVWPKPVTNKNLFMKYFTYTYEMFHVVQILTLL